MEDWIKITLILCFFGMLREIRPSEPFVTEFLLGEWRNITNDQLNREVYPIGTYSYLALLVVVFLITDFLRFKPVIILSGLSGISVYAVLLWTSSIEWLQVSQFLYGLYMATEVAYLTYIYAKVDSAKYPLVSSYTRIAALTGRFLSGVSSQLLTHFGLMDYRQLNYITFTGIFHCSSNLGYILGLLVTPVPYGIYFHRRSIENTFQVDNATPKDKLTSFNIIDIKGTFINEVKNAAFLITNHARSAYTRPKILAWSALYAAALALFVQAQTYIQLLWKQIQKGNDSPVVYNGAVEAIQTLLGALGSLTSSHLPRPLYPGLAAAVQGAAMFISAFIDNVFVSYAGYIVMGLLYHYIITLASAKIACQLSDESCFGLIFGINTLIGTGLQSILTVVLIQTLSLSIVDQYYSISGLFMFLAAIWIFGLMVHTCKEKNYHVTTQY